MVVPSVAIKPRYGRARWQAAGSKVIHSSHGSKRQRKGLESQYPGQGHTPSAQCQELPVRLHHLPLALQTHDQAQRTFEDMALLMGTTAHTIMPWNSRAQRKQQEWTTLFRTTTQELGLSTQLSRHGLELLSAAPWLCSAPESQTHSRKKRLH